MKLGDVVRLKSGGPIMVIFSGANLSAEYPCRWFSKKNKVKTAYFKAEELLLVEEETAPLDQAALQLRILHALETKGPMASPREMHEYLDKEMKIRTTRVLVHQAIWDLISSRQIILGLDRIMRLPE